ncbi:DUF396-domain-containing protein [Rickenella mellea]|uniref:DUF396-domain-containing protein n=1 Tax=Rickenella mellea TaxID=50990 RepID=A0A4R5XHE6_9AGAM|nr:DUF396-domain-containing protein [Rickenella mellea]
MSLLHALSYAGAVCAFAFVILSLASGLLWIAEIIEEHSTTAKAAGKRGIYAIIALHVLLYFFDSLPPLHLLFSILCHLVYLQNFSRTWPFISLTSASFVASCLLCVSDHFIWFFYFSRRAHEARDRAHRSYRGSAVLHDEYNLSFAEIATFFATCVWLVPLFLFLSLSANDNALPTAANGHVSRPSSPTYFPGSPTIGSTSRASLFKTVFDFFPRITSKSRLSEGIIAPRTPAASAPSTPAPTTSRFSQSSMFPPSPLLSPGPHLMERRMSAELGVDGDDGRTVRLSMPPRRSSRGPDDPNESPKPVRRTTEDGKGSAGRRVGLGLRSRDSTM